jgi:hypothetical protein
MRREIVLKHEFVEFIPDKLEDGIVYVSIPYATVAHKCCCGCGMEVVTPLSPTDWKLIFDGETISLDPSIGNWSFDCKSHYWIRRDRVRWAERWSREKIEAARTYERIVRERPPQEPAEDQAIRVRDGNSERRFWGTIRKWRRWLGR